MTNQGTSDQVLCHNLWLIKELVTRSSVCKPHSTHQVTYNDKSDTNIYESTRNLLSWQLDEEEMLIILLISNDWAIYKEKKYDL